MKTMGNGKKAEDKIVGNIWSGLCHTEMCIGTKYWKETLKWK